MLELIGSLIDTIDGLLADESKMAVFTKEEVSKMVIFRERLLTFRAELLEDMKMSKSEKVDSKFWNKGVLLVRLFYEIFFGENRIDL